MKFILQRPIATFMIALAFLILGLVASFQIPTALLPNIPVPEITIQVSYPNQTARNLETNVIRQLRNQLQQIAQLKDIETEARDGFGLLKLKFEYGVSTDLAFIEANEKIDMAMNFLPRDLPRPRVIKASTSDIPVVFLSVSIPNNNSQEAFLDLSEFSFNVLKRRIEQLPDIAIADISGHLFAEVQIQPNLAKLQSLGLDQGSIVQAINNNNFEIGDLLIEDGIYQYNLRFSSPLQNKEDLENIRINHNQNIYRLKDLAKVKIVPEQIRGASSTNKDRAIQIALIKQAEASVYEMNEKLSEFILEIEKEYPHLKFETHQDQTTLLKLSIDNLKSSLILGGILAIVIIFVFMQDLKSPVIIGVSIPLALIISFFLLYIFGLSINIISLSGLILGVGMMIDNSIIVIDNITQKLNEGFSIFEACKRGTSEIISPLVSSVLTTCMVFFPLVFLSGVTGALFYDQALAVAIGLVSSLLVAIFVIPSIYLQIHKKTKKQSLKKDILAHWYKKGFAIFYTKKYLTLTIALGFLGCALFLFKHLEFNKLPQLEEQEMRIKVDWNKNVGVEDNLEKSQLLLEDIKDITYVVEAAEQRYLLQREPTQNFSETQIYLKASSPTHLENVKKEILKRVENTSWVVDFLPPKNIFQYVFGDEENELTAEITSREKIELPYESEINSIEKLLPFAIQETPMQNIYNLQIKHENLLLYQVDYQKLIDEVKTVLQRNFVSELRNVQRFIPIRMGYEETNMQKSLQSNFVLNQNNQLIPLYQLVEVKKEIQYKSIHGKRSGEFLKILPQEEVKITHQLLEKTKNKFASSPYNINFSGSFLEKGNLLNELLGVIGVSIVLLYLIMAAQFNSLTQPLIILTEIPIDIGGSLVLVWLFGGDINLMTGIGIVVMSGIVINDSILKIHTMNQLKASGLSMDEAILEGGKRRLKPILMTSITSILALLPFLFIGGLGADLQKPLALAVIGGLAVGTFISLYFLPILYKWFSKDQ
ncbi:MAG: efflux RND transporter permease subunit [Flavobacteriaceae bacterium]|nr:efflux RND transporter permease subunit [Flavobacteriaceae bacterium]